MQLCVLKTQKNRPPALASSPPSYSRPSAPNPVWDSYVLSNSSEAHSSPLRSMREVDYRTTENATHNLTKRGIKQYKEQRGEAPPERFRGSMPGAHALKSDLLRDQFLLELLCDDTRHLARHWNVCRWSRWTARREGRPRRRARTRAYRSGRREGG